MLALEALQEKKYVYRDLKPENLMIDAKGYLKVVDFGFAKVVEDQTHTLCGTPDYLPPEIISLKGHNHAADWWSTGILIFELVNGSPPFQASSPMVTYKMITKFNGNEGRGGITFGPHFSDECKDLILKFLRPNPQLRLGALKNGARDVKAHPWFKDIDWDALIEKRLDAPWTPNVKDAKDLGNFTDEYPDSDTEDVPYTGDPSWYADF